MSKSKTGNLVLQRSNQHRKLGGDRNTANVANPTAVVPQVASSMVPIGIDRCARAIGRLNSTGGRDGRSIGPIKVEGFDYATL